MCRYFVCRALQFPPEAWLRISLKHASITWITIRSLLIAKLHITYQNSWTCEHHLDHWQVSFLPAKLIDYQLLKFEHASLTLIISNCSYRQQKETHVLVEYCCLQNLLSGLTGGCLSEVWAKQVTSHRPYSPPPRLSMRLFHHLINSPSGSSHLL